MIDLKEWQGRFAVFKVFNIGMSFILFFLVFVCTGVVDSGRYDWLNLLMETNLVVWVCVDAVFFSVNRRVISALVRVE